MQIYILQLHILHFKKPVLIAIEMIYSIVSRSLVHFKVSKCFSAGRVAFQAEMPERPAS